MPAKEISYEERQRQLISEVKAQCAKYGLSDQFDAVGGEQMINILPLLNEKFDSAFELLSKWSVDRMTIFRMDQENGFKDHLCKRFAAGCWLPPTTKFRRRFDALDVCELMDGPLTCRLVQAKGAYIPKFCPVLPSFAEQVRTIEQNNDSLRIGGTMVFMKEGEKNYKLVRNLIEYGCGMGETINVKMFGKDMECVPEVNRENNSVEYIPCEDIKRALSSYDRAAKKFEYTGKINGVKLSDEEANAYIHGAPVFVKGMQRRGGKGTYDAWCRFSLNDRANVFCDELAKRYVENQGEARGESRTRSESRSESRSQTESLSAAPSRKAGVKMNV